MRFLLRSVLLVTLGLLCAATTLRADLLSHWPFDGDLVDVVSGNDGTFQGGAAVFVDGYDGAPGGAVQFDGVDDIVIVTHTAGLPISTQPAFTIAMWVKGPIQRDKRVFSEGSSTSDTPLFNIGTDNLAATTGAVDIFIRGTATPLNHIKSLRAAYDNAWHHIAWVDNGGAAVLYVDGVRDGRVYTYARTTLAVDRTSIGGILRAAACCWFAGAIDDVRIYNHALAREDVEAIATPPATCVADADTHCSGITIVDGPTGGAPGVYTFGVNAVDDTGDPISVIMAVENSSGVRIQETIPLATPSLDVLLTAGTWTITAVARDNVVCRDDAADSKCTLEVNVSSTPMLVSNWPLDGDLLDNEPAANHGTMLPAGNVPVFVDGHDGTPGGALSVDGVDDIVSFTQQTHLPIYGTAPSHTIAFWVKGPTNQVDRRMFSEGSTLSGTQLLNLGTDNTGTTGKFDVFIRTDANVQVQAHRKSDRNALDDTWHHVAWVDDAGRAILYIDGIRDATDFNYTRAPLTLNTTSLGGILRAAAGSFFAGAIDDLRIYNYALTQTDVEGLVPEPEGCPADGDTHAASLTVTGPPDRTAGSYTATATVTDDSADTVFYHTFVLTNDAGVRRQVGPTLLESAVFDLQQGTWTVTVTVDDDLACRDAAPDATRSVTLSVAAEPAILLSHWTFDADLLDSEPAANNGVFTLPGGAPTFAEGIECAEDSAVSFDGLIESGIVETTHTTGLPISTHEAFSITMWVKGLPQVDKRVFSESARGANRTQLYNIGTHNTGANGAVDIFIRDSAGTSRGHLFSTGMAFDGRWHHIAWIDDKGAARLYIDGVLDATDFNYARTTSWSLDVTTVGGILRTAAATGLDDVCCVFDGEIDDTRVFTFALNADEVADIYGDGPADCCPPAGDTFCDGVSVTGPADKGPGVYRVEAAAFDASGDAISYTFRASQGGGAPMVVGPQAGNAADFTLGAGAWDVSVVVDDDPFCEDVAEENTCTTIVEVCPAAGDTHCGGVTVSGPEDGGPGMYTVTAAATDDSGDAIAYTFTADPGDGEILTAGPQAEASAMFELTPGTWTLSVSVDDDADCSDTAGDTSCSTEVTVVIPGGGQIPGDCNQDGEINVSDPSCLLGYLFLGTPETLPCGNGEMDDPANVLLEDWNADGIIDLTDAVGCLNWLFLGGPAHALDTNETGQTCVRIIGCVDACTP